MSDTHGRKKVVRVEKALDQLEAAYVKVVEMVEMCLNEDADISWYELEPLMHTVDKLQAAVDGYNHNKADYSLSGETNG